MNNPRQLGLSAAITCALAAGLAAQTTTPPAPVAPPDQMTTITVSGCVQRSPTVAGARATSPYVLASAHSTAAGAETPDAVMVSSTVRVYQLAGNEEEVGKNVGRTVEITGTVDKRDAAAQATGGTPPPRKLTITTMKDGTGACGK